jgi:plasmid stabilization system protein ParE
MKLRFTPRATKDIAEIAAYIRTRNPVAAERVRDSILDAMQTLVLFPKTGRAQALEGVRKLVTRKYHYLVYYIVDVLADEIVILTIQHPAREREFSDQ